MICIHDTDIVICVEKVLLICGLLSKYYMRENMEIFILKILVSPHLDKLPRTLWNTMVNIQKANEQGFIAVLHVAHYSECVCFLIYTCTTCTTWFCQPGQHAMFISWYILHLEFTLYQFSTKKFITVNSEINAWLYIC